VLRAQQQEPDDRRRSCRTQVAEDGRTAENAEQDQTETIRDQKTMDSGDQHDFGVETYGRQTGMNTIPQRPSVINIYIYMCL